MATMSAINSLNVTKTSSEPAALKKVNSETSFASTLKKLKTNGEQELQKTEQVVQDDVQNNLSEEDASTVSKNYSLQMLLTSITKTENALKEEVVDVMPVLEVTSLQQLGEVLGVTLNDWSVIDESLTLESMSALLGLNAQQVQEAITKATGQKVTSDTSIWHLLRSVEENSMSVMTQLVAALNGKGNTQLSKTEAAQLTKLLKFMELSAAKSDLTLQQEMQNAQLSKVMDTLAQKVERVTTQAAVSTPSLFSKMMHTSVTQETSAEATQPVQMNGAINASLAAKTTHTATITVPSNSSLQGEAFINKFTEVMNRSQFAKNAEGTRLLIKLYPEKLGTIRVELIQKDGVLSARILASTAQGKQMLDSQLHQLKSGLASQNLQLDRIDVSQAISEPSRSEKEQAFNREQQSTKQFKQDQTNEEKNNEEFQSFEDFLAALEEI